LIRTHFVTKWNDVSSIHEKLMCLSEVKMVPRLFAGWLYLRSVSSRRASHPVPSREIIKESLRHETRSLEEGRAGAGDCRGVLGWQGSEVRLSLPRIISIDWGPEVSNLNGFWCARNLSTEFARPSLSCGSWDLTSKSLKGRFSKVCVSLHHSLHTFTSGWLSGGYACSMKVSARITVTLKPWHLAFLLLCHKRGYISSDVWNIKHLKHWFTKRKDKENKLASKIYSWWSSMSQSNYRTTLLYRALLIPPNP
jgi:hypothetical protein